MRVFNTLFTLVAVLITADKAHARALPAMGSDACQGALPINELVRVAVVKSNYKGCPAGNRSPYLCALHTAGLAYRNLGHAMRTTIADLGNGTCGRVNLRGVLIYTADGRELHGDRFEDPTKRIPHNVRFGAWRTDVLYLTPVAGEEQLAQVTSERNECRAELKPAEQCGQDGKLYDPATQTCVDQKVAAPAVAVAAECPVCPDCPAADTRRSDQRARKSQADLQQCLQERDQERDRFREELTHGEGALCVAKRQECEDRGALLNPESMQCFSGVTLSHSEAELVTTRLAALNKLVMDARLCQGRRGQHFRYTSPTSGECVRAPPAN